MEHTDRGHLIGHIPEKLGACVVYYLQTNGLPDAPLTREVSSLAQASAQEGPVGLLSSHQHLCPPFPPFAPSFWTCDQIPPVPTPGCTGASQGILKNINA